MSHFNCALCGASTTTNRPLVEDMVCLGCIEGNPGGVNLFNANKEIEALRAELQKERECVDWYANKENWTHFDMHSWTTGDSTPRGDVECLDGAGKIGSKSYGGKRARQRQQQRREV